MTAPERRHLHVAGEPINPEPLRVDPVAFRREQVATVWARAVPTRFANATADHPGIVTWTDRYLNDPTACPSLLLAGPTGTGKTWAAYGALRRILHTLAEKGRGLDWRLVSHPDLNAEQRPQPDDSHVYALDRYLAAQLLILDDLGAGKQTDWTGDSLYRLVDHRWSRCLPTIFSTNLVQDRLIEAVGERVVSRLGDATRVSLKGADRRWARDGGAA